MLLALLLALALQKPAAQTLTETWPDGSPRVVREVLSDGAGGWIDDGAYTAYHENGARAEVGRHAKGLRVGQWESFHPNGKPASKGRYVTGRMDGKWSFWRDDGVENLADSGAYQPVVETDEQGRVVCAGQLRDGQSHGAWSFYWDDGSLLAQGSYRSGVRQGEWIAFGLDGAPVQLCLSGEYEAGRRTRALDPERLAQLAASAGKRREASASAAAPGWLSSADGSAERLEELKRFDAERPRRARELAAALLTLRVEDDTERAAAAQWCERLATLARGHGLVDPSAALPDDRARLQELLRAWSLLLATSADQWLLWSLQLRPSCTSHASAPSGGPCPLLASPQLRGEPTAPHGSARAAAKWYARRTSDAKARIKLCGGEKEAAALDAALAWLVAHQGTDGSWDPAGFSSKCAAHSAPACQGDGESLNRVGVTSLALLALLGDGSTLSRGAHRDAVRAATIWLLDQQNRESGRFTDSRLTTFMYEQAVATWALSEALLFDEAPELRRAVEVAVEYLLKSRNGSAGGLSRWSYNVPGMEARFDSSLSSCIVLALSAARDAEVAVEASVFAGALRFLTELTDPATGRTGYDSIGSSSSRVTRINDHFPSDANEPLTALALAARLAGGELPKSEPLIAKGSALLLAKLPRWETGKLSVDFYYWAFGAQAMQALAGAVETGPWMRALRVALLAGQERAGGAKGSWDPTVDPWGYSGGRVYTTAMGALALEGPLRVDPARYPHKK